MGKTFLDWKCLMSGLCKFTKCIARSGNEACRCLPLLMNLALSGLIFVTVSPTYAKPPSPDKSEASEETLPQDGLLAAQGNVPFRDVSLSEPWGGSNPPFVANVSRTTRDEWVFTLENKSQKTFKIVVEFAQFDMYKEKVKTDKFWITLKPEKTESKTILSAKKVVGAGLFLVKWSEL